jgi:hypothetical protein
MNYLTHGPKEHQDLAIFLTLAIGFLIGHVKIGSGLQVYSACK